VSRKPLLLSAVLAVALIVGAVWLMQGRGRTSQVDPAAASAEFRSRDTLDLAVLARQLKANDWETRFAAVRTLSFRSDIPVSPRADLLLETLHRELAQPTSAPPPEGSYLTATQLLRLHTAHALGRLGGAAHPAMRARLSRTTGEEHEWILLGLGYAGDVGTSPEIRQVLRSSSSGPVRMTAAHVLGKLKERAAVPELEAALSDPFTARVLHNDVGGPADQTLYPVRSRAASALRSLGIPVEKRGDSNTVK
jgi:HEAT repeat protein